MNNRLLPPAKASHRTARGRMVAALTEEILGNPQTEAFLIASEYELCRRFNVSRVTVRLALGDLENRGLIFRKHGKGTFAHGCATRRHRNIAVLMPASPMTEKRAVFDLIRGVHAMVTSVGAALVLTGLSPEKWSAELASSLGGVMIVSEQVAPEGMESLKNRKLPFLLLGETHLPGLRLLLDPEELTHDNNIAKPSLGDDFFTVGYAAAEALSRAALTGEPLSDRLIEMRAKYPAVSSGSECGQPFFDEATGIPRGLRRGEFIL